MNNDGKLYTQTLKKVKKTIEKVYCNVNILKGYESKNTRKIDCMTYML